MSSRTSPRVPAPIACAAWLSGCAGPQSALDPAGRGAERLAELFWWMAGGAAVVWLAVAALAVYAVRGGARRAGGGAQRALIVWGGAVVPTLVLGALLAYGLSILPGLLASAPPGALRISVTGEQWWWRVRYESPGEAVELANEIRLPAGEPVEFTLRSADVLHSFWIPSLGGKMDMFPGRETRLLLEPTRPGRLRGVCAEYCGESHALMAFDVVVLEKPEFARWLAAQRRPAAVPAGGAAARGGELFGANGCAACHTVRGTGADGVVGPDLTHAGGRLSIAAGTLPPGRAGFGRWLAKTHEVKPGALMPHFGMLPPEDLTALAAYLEALR
ncbi:MAG: cytochrome c oxidase subunit II [Elusimicrobia bacterium]|nr:cytochrome c oxidase subunit II [Elusimicrobiota bacterium]